MVMVMVIMVTTMARGLPILHQLLRLMLSQDTTIMVMVIMGTIMATTDITVIMDTITVRDLLTLHQLLLLRLMLSQDITIMVMVITDTTMDTTDITATTGTITERGLLTLHQLLATDIMAMDTTHTTDTHTFMSTVTIKPYSKFNSIQCS